MVRAIEKVLIVALVFLAITGCRQTGVITERRIQALAFDAFPIFDPRPIAKAAEEVFPGQGQDLMAAWRTRIFEYQWLRALGGEYEDFMQAAESALIFAATSMELELTPDHKDRLLSEFMSLNVWPDVPAAIKQLREMDVELVFLSNMTSEMLRNGLKKAGLEEDFVHVISTDRIRSYKPASGAYDLGVQELSLEKDEILFVAFAGWDVAGAKWYGYPTFWVNRLGSPLEELGVAPDGTSRDLSGLIEFVARANQ